MNTADGKFDEFFLPKAKINTAPFPSARLGIKNDVLGTPQIEMAGATGLEPTASCVTGRRSNQLPYAPAYYDRLIPSGLLRCPSHSLTCHLTI
jgi:hypothetical protein